MKNEYEHAGTISRYELYKVPSIESCIDGYYAVDGRVTSDEPSEFVWNNRGNGPEVTNDGVYGPFQSLADAKEFVTKAQIDREDEEFCDQLYSHGVYEHRRVRSLGHYDLHQLISDDDDEIAGYYLVNRWLTTIGPSRFIWISNGRQVAVARHGVEGPMSSEIFAEETVSLCEKNGF